MRIVTNNPESTGCTKTLQSCQSLVVAVQKYLNSEMTYHYPGTKLRLGHMYYIYFLNYRVLFPCKSHFAQPSLTRVLLFLFSCDLETWRSHCCSWVTPD